MASILHWIDIRRPGKDTNPDDAFWQTRILAEGDSWFTLGGLPEQCNLLQSLTLPNRTIIVSLAKPGDTIRSMAEIWKNQALHQAMDAGPPKFGSDWDLILLSGGGNDLIDYAKDLIKPIAEVNGNNPADFVRLDRLAIVLDYIQQAYRNIIGLRDGPHSTCSGKPVVTHTYDHATPRDAPAKFFGAKIKGPWLFRAFVDAGAPENLFIGVADFLIDALADAILALEHGANPLPNFHVVDTRGTLQRSALGTTGNDGDWLNEIHPNRGGYDKRATRGRRLPALRLFGRSRTTLRGDSRESSGQHIVCRSLESPPGPQGRAGPKYGLRKDMESYAVMTKRSRQPRGRTTRSTGRGQKRRAG